ncbi:Anthranilate 1,2-dioxygenase large subunit [Rubripirellula tenax]|uniref:Anthranilate 1,2-dioxygenase large subunit n=1 Tax=Rubripirellula tenax TaxID=2528015 RepID=A0A5C6EQQ2_9BACT|nr:aromatic ring-hydroxylating dioxygenase subunit alpha [Rubripirellula tenax]TWU50975.1 Anthranilate 1,2-dioxygenase large subunit [Rubripirellula tenax]
MFVHKNRLRHLLRPPHYRDAEHFRTEVRQLFVPSWQFATTASELSRDGDFQTLTLLDTPILIRNFGGDIRAFINVCPHRHSMLTCAASGNSPVLKCQYHGWQFGVDGKTRKIPEPNAFRPWDRENSMLTPVRLQRCGDLLFVTLSDSVPELSDWMSPMFEEVESHFTTPLHRMGEVWEFDAACNWKVPVENTLESYHVAEVHPDWLGGVLPEEKFTQHHLDPRYTTLHYFADNKADRKMADVCRQLGGKSTPGYRHWHMHPNLVFVVTETFNYFVSCQPTGPTTCRLRSRMYPLWGTARTPWRKLVRFVAWRIGRRMMRGVFEQDRTVFGAQQRGIEASSHRGVIGIREERIHTFQKYVCEHTNIAPEVEPFDGPESDAAKSDAAKSEVQKSIAESSQTTPIENDDAPNDTLVVDDSSD